MRKILLLFFILFVLSTGLLADISDDAKRIVDTNRNAVVRINVVLKMTMSMFGESEEDEQKLSVPGTIIDKNGLIVTSFTGINPVNVINSMLKGLSELELNIETSYSSMKVCFSNGEEIDGDVVLTDKNSDLAFIMLKSAPKSDFAVADIAQSSSVRIFDNVVFLSPAPIESEFIINSTIETVNAILDIPCKLCYIDHINSSFFVGIPGFPAFTADGKLIGPTVSFVNPELDMKNMSSISQSILAVQFLNEQKELIASAKAMTSK